eukprot:7390573-Prymnesium_polylepis.1
MLNTHSSSFTAPSPCTGDRWRTERTTTHTDHRTAHNPWPRGGERTPAHKRGVTQSTSRDNHARHCIMLLFENSVAPTIAMYSTAAHVR